MGAGSTATFTDVFALVAFLSRILIPQLVTIMSFCIPRTTTTGHRIPYAAIRSVLGISTFMLGR
jgi:hypothetical protein